MWGVDEVVCEIREDAERGWCKVVEGGLKQSDEKCRTGGRQLSMTSLERRFIPLYNVKS